jgi:hypothetical protein
MAKPDNTANAKINADKIIPLFIALWINEY